MKKYFSSIIRSASIVLSSITLSTGSASAALTLIDFGTGSSPVEPGYTAQTSGAATSYSTPEGTITVASTGSFFSRPGSTAALYRDFTFLNSSGALTLTIGGAGILANTDYEIEFFSYDSQHGGGGGTVTYTGVSDTIGGTSIAYSNTFPDNNAATTVFTSNGSGEIVIDVTGTNEGPRVNGMIINSTSIPEPSSTALLGLGGLALILRRRK